MATQMATQTATPVEETSQDVEQKQRKKAFKTRLEKFLQLQDICSRLGELEAEINILSKQTDIEEHKYNSKQTQYENNLAPLKKAEAEVTTIDTELIEVQEKIEKCEDTKKKIKTIKEFKAINKEIDFLNQQNTVKETHLLSKKEEVKFRKTKLEKIEENLNEIKQVFEEKKGEFEELLNERKEDIKKCRNEKAAVEKKIDPKWVDIFTRIYQNKNDLAIVAAAASTSEENLVCQGCYTLLPRQLEIELKRDTDITYCPFCSRMLYHAEVLE